jgi:hypothetical protein
MSFESGVKQGDRLIRFLRALAVAGGRLSEFRKTTFGCSERQAAYYWGNFTKHKPADATRGFLRTIIPDRSVDQGLVRLMPFEELTTYIDGYPPFCHFSKDLGLAGFAQHEADAWVFDLNDGSICTIDIGEYQKTYAEISARADARAGTLAQWCDYLINEAIDREWLPDRSRSELA